MENKEGEPVTLDDLARMVAAGFTEIRSTMATKDDLAELATKDDFERLREETGAGFIAVNERVDRIADGLRARMDQFDAKLDEHRGQTRDELAAIRNVMSGLSHALVDHEERITAMEGE